MQNGSRILVVDDDEEICTVLQLILELQGHSVLALQRADRVAEVLSAEPIKLIVLDMLIGSAKGTDVCMQLKGNDKTAGIPIMMLTALPDAEKVCRAAGADDFISKPFDMDSLISKVNQLLLRD